MDRTRRQTGAILLGAAAAAFAPARAHARADAPSLAPPANPPVSAGQDAPAGPIATGADAFDHLTAPVMINGQGPYPFVVDTGANISCVARGLAQALKLPFQEPRPMHTIVGVRDQPLALVDELRVGDQTRRDMPMLAASLDNPKLAGVLGVDWLQDQRLTLDFARKSLEFAASHDDWRRSGQVIVPARRRLGQLTIIDATLGATRISAMIDSGSQASLCNTALLKLLDRSARPAKRQVISMVSILGEPFAGDLVFLPFLKLGGLQLGNVPVVYADTHVFEIWGLAQTPAVLLGMDLLRQFRAVSLDFGRSQVRFDLLAA